MDIQFYLEKLKATNEFKKFIKENPKAHLCSGFFVFDKEKSKNPDNKVHFDFYSPEKDKAFSFEMNKSVRVVPLDNFSKAPMKISENISFDFDEIEGALSVEMQKNSVKEKIQKIIFSMNNHKGKAQLNAVVFISMLGMLKANISLPDKKITNFEKKSFFEMFKVIKKDKKKEN